MSLDDALAAAIETVPDCIAGAYMDMGTGLLLAVNAEDPDDEDVIEAVAAAMPDLFEGTTLSDVAAAFGKDGAPPTEASFNEFIIFGDTHVHVFQRSRALPDHVLSLVCRRNAKIGLVLAKSRKTVETVAAAI